MRAAISFVLMPSVQYIRPKDSGVKDVYLVQPCRTQAPASFSLSPTKV
jgi:hypothetical protein